MPDRTLLVPGTQATSLADQNGTVVYNAVRVSVGLQKDDLGGRPPSEWAALLGMEHRAGLWPPTRTSLDPATELRPVSVVRTPYDRIWDAVEPWPYDWRGDIRHNAIRLLRHLEAEKPQGGRWNLIGHSQGGLVIVLASKLTARVDDFSRLVARVILVGAPLAGTMRATEALLWGSEGLGAGAEKIAIARTLGRTWPALYQMLPSWDAVVLNDKGKLAPEDQQFTVPGGWPGEWGTGIQVDLLQRARETQTLLHGPFSQFGSGVMTLAFQGQKQASPVTVVCKNGQYPEKRVMKSEPGDSLVPSKRTLEWGGGPFARQVTVLTGKPRRHAELCDDEDIVDMILEFLEEEAPPPPGIH